MTDSLSDTQLEKINQAITTMVDKFGKDNVTGSYNASTGLVVISARANIIAQVRTYVEQQIKPILIVDNKQHDNFIPETRIPFQMQLFYEKLPHIIEMLEPPIFNNRKGNKKRTYNKLRSYYMRTRFNQQKQIRKQIRTKHK